jgi:hypothetical protein
MNNHLTQKQTEVIDLDSPVEQRKRKLSEHQEKLTNIQTNIKTQQSSNLKAVQRQSESANANKKQKISNNNETRTNSPSKSRTKQIPLQTQTQTQSQTQTQTQNQQPTKRTNFDIPLDCMIQIRETNGNILKQSFSLTQHTVVDVFLWLQRDRTDEKTVKISLVTPMPRIKLEINETKTLKDLGFGPRTLIIAEKE